MRNYVRCVFVKDMLIRKTAYALNALQMSWQCVCNFSRIFCVFVSLSSLSPVWRCIFLVHNLWCYKLTTSNLILSLCWLMLLQCCCSDHLSLLMQWNNYKFTFIRHRNRHLLCDVFALSLSFSISNWVKFKAYAWCVCLLNAYRIDWPTAIFCSVNFGKYRPFVHLSVKLLQKHTSRIKYIETINMMFRCICFYVHPTECWKNRYVKNASPNYNPSSEMRIFFL